MLDYSQMDDDELDQLRTKIEREIAGRRRYKLVTTTRDTWDMKLPGAENKTLVLYFELDTQDEELELIGARMGKTLIGRNTL